MINLIGASQNLYGGLKGYQNNASSFGSMRNELLKKYKEEQYQDIFEHEKAHKDAAGDLGGPIVIENNAQGIPVAGHVDIKMPVLNKENPDETIKHAETVIDSAMAPDDPSAQDYRVANEAKSIKSQAENEKNKSGKDDFSPQIGKSLNFIA